MNQLQSKALYRLLLRAFERNMQSSNASVYTKRKLNACSNLSVFNHFQETVKTTLARLDDVRQMHNKRRQELTSLGAKLKKPTSSVASVPARSSRALSVANLSSPSPADEESFFVSKKWRKLSISSKVRVYVTFHRFFIWNIIL
jgi:hypothetical protein